jgi:hypothetical protein
MKFFEQAGNVYQPQTIKGRSHLEGGFCFISSYEYNHARFETPAVSFDIYSTPLSELR